MEELQAPPAPVISTQSLPELLDACSDPTPRSSPNPPSSPPPSHPVAGPSRRTVLKRSRWSGDDSGEESDEFTPEVRKAARPCKRPKVGSLKRASAKFDGKSTKCGLCGKRLGRATDLPRHLTSCKANPERETRRVPCEFCGKLLPGTSNNHIRQGSLGQTRYFTVRPDAVKRHRESKTCLSKRNKGDDEDPYLSGS